VCLVDVLTLLLFVRRHYALKAVLLELLYDDRPCRVAHVGLTERTERDDCVVGHLARRLVRARARGDGTGRKRGAKVNWPSVCLSPAGSHGNGLSCVPHANTGVLSNMSDVSVQATVSFIITFRKKNVASDIISSVADKLGDRRVPAPRYPRPLTRVTFMQGRSGCCCVGWEGRARTATTRLTAARSTN
jgi:hypothetical protein